MFKDFYMTRRSTALIKADPERRKQRRVALIIFTGLEAKSLNSCKL